MPADDDGLLFETTRQEEEAMKFTCEAGGVPPGAYRAKFAGCKPFEQRTPNEYGPAVVLTWKVIGGQCDGQDAGRICGAKLTPQTVLGKFAAAVKGSPLQVGETFDFDRYVGRPGSLSVEATERGGSRVSAFIPDPPKAKVQPQVVEPKPEADWTPDDEVPF
jgi:hypothetical protein